MVDGWVGEREVKSCNWDDEMWTLSEDFLLIYVAYGNTKVLKVFESNEMSGKSDDTFATLKLPMKLNSLVYLLCQMYNFTVFYITCVRFEKYSLGYRI